MPDILVTGGAGFIGSHLVEELASQGYQVTCLDNFSTGQHNNIAHLPDVEVIEGDANTADVWRQLSTRTFAAVFHYAATVGIQHTEENPLAVLADAAGLRHVAVFARAGHAKRVIFASSSEVYGDPQQLPEKETDGYSGRTPYTTVKMYGEHLCASLWQEARVPTVILRFFNVYGPNQRGNAYGFVAAQFIEQALRGQSVTIHGDGQQARDFVYISDNVAAAIAALTSPRAHGQVINVGTGRETSIEQLAYAVIAAANSDSQLTHTKARARDIRRRCADTTRLQELLGTSCATELVDGLPATIAWYRQNQTKTPFTATATAPVAVPTTTAV